MTGVTLTAARRRGKSIWLETDDGDGPVLGIHLGMAGRVVVDDAEAGDPRSEAERGDPRRWDRFALTFADGGRLALRDARRLGRVRLEPDLDGVGPDAARIGRVAFRERVGRSSASIKARILDQSVLAGQPARRRGAVARAHRSAAAGADAGRRGPRPAAARDPRGHARRDPPRRRAHGQDRPVPRPRRALSALRRSDAARDGGRAHHMVVSARAALSRYLVAAAFPCV